MRARLVRTHATTERPANTSKFLFPTPKIHGGLFRPPIAVDPFPRRGKRCSISRARCNLSRNPATTIRTQTNLERIASNALIRDDGPRAFLHLEKLESNFMGGRKRVETSAFLSGDKMLHRCVNNNASERERERESFLSKECN